ncbi:MAG: hypothetical protein A2X64_03825 [Ignavibacteria bacterium GWF2_33_9]|nr:MAG: hypothetical protein A2X64_03825 [Ignavibacteria bacterium GWF2_33_9]
MRIYLLTIAILLSLFSIDTNAQDELENPLMPYQETRPIFIGPVFGYNRSMHSVSLKTFADEGNVNTDPCPTFDNGQSNGFYVGFTYEHILGDYKNSNSSIIARVMYQTMPSYLEIGGDEYPSLVTIVDADGNVVDEQIVNSSTLWTAEVDYSMITFEAVYKINPFEGNNLGFTIGPTFDYALTKNLDQRMKLVTPRNAQFKRPEPGTGYDYLEYADNDRTIIFFNDEIPNSSAFRFGMKIGIQYEILMGRMYVVPGIQYNFGITNLTSEESWRVSPIQAGFDIRFSI